MKACGIVAEYNPFHNGHKWHIDQARKTSNAEVIIVVMSGNFMQRGEPAIVDKWLRTEMALHGGADLVVELPMAYAVQPADIFAKGAINVLQRLHCETLSFGVEKGDAVDYKGAAAWYTTHKDAIDQRMRVQSISGQTHAANMAEVLKTFDGAPEFLRHLNSPNAQLGFSYAKENSLYEKPMNLLPIIRYATQHSDIKITDEAFASGTSIRTTLLNQTSDSWKKIKPVVPPKTFELLKRNRHQAWEDFWPYAAYQLQVQTPENLRRIYQMTEGLENRLKGALDPSQSLSFEEYMEKIKTKRYTWTRLQRLLVYVLLQLEETELHEAHSQSQAIRVLGFTKMGQAYLNFHKTKTNERLVTNLKRSNSEKFKLDIRTGDIYNMVIKDEPQDFSRSPIMPFR